MLLLDTHVLLWWLQDSRKLRAQARRGDCAPRNLLVTQARLEHLRLVTGDAVLSGYDVPTLDART